MAASRANTEIRDIPQSVAVLTEAFFDDMQARALEDVLP